MIEKIKELLKNANEEGLKLPFAKDGVTGQPSVSLLFAYVTFMTTLVVGLFLSYKDILSGSIFMLTFWTLSTVFYLIRKITKFKADLDDKSIELDGGEEPPTKG